MAKRSTQTKRRYKNKRVKGNVVLLNEDSYVEFHSATTLTAKTPAQKTYLQSIEANTLTFGIGPAGTGKSYCATMLAAKALREKRVSKIIITRPAVEAKGGGGGLGFLPGKLEEKADPYFQPIKVVLEAFFGRSHLELLLKRKTIEFCPLEHMRGVTFDNAFVILDEAENTTLSQLKLFLTRIGLHTKVVVNGDIDQQDIKGLSGLTDAVTRFAELNDSKIVSFSEDDVVRSGIVRDILKCYRTP